MADIDMTPNVGDDVDYIDIIQKLKESTVSKESYDKLREDNRKLAEALMKTPSHKASKDSEDEDEDRQDYANDIKELSKKFNSNQQMSNLEYVENVLRLRRAMIAEGHQDPFLPCGNHVRITADQIDAAERTADVMQQCVDIAKGDSGIFTAELQRRIKESNLIVRR